MYGRCEVSRISFVTCPVFQIAYALSPLTNTIMSAIRSITSSGLAILQEIAGDARRFSLASSRFSQTLT